MSCWPLRRAPFWAEAPLFHLMLPLIIAIVAYDRGWLGVSSAWAIIAAASLLLLFSLLFIRKWPAAAKPLFFTSLYTAVFAFGIWRTQTGDARTNADWFARNQDSTKGNLVTILDEPAEKERIWRMQVGILKNNRADKIQQTSGKAYLNIYKNDTTIFNYHRGDLLLVPANWQEMNNSGNPFEVDYKTMNRRKNICHQQFAGPDNVQLYRKANASPSLLEKVHRYCDAQLTRFVPDSATHGLLQAMLLGDESSFDPELRQAYSETGVIHIVSISGSHVGVLFAAIALLLSGVRGHKGLWLRLCVGLFVIWFYVLMAGAPPSAIRAALMFSILGLGTAFNKEANPLNTLFAAAIALLCYHPMWLFAVGFQLSFGAVLSLILFYQPIYQLWPQTHKVFRWLWQGASASIAAEILTAPLVIYYFHNFPLFFLIANILAAVLVGLLALLGGMLIIVFSPLPPLANLVAWTVTLFVKAFNQVIQWLQAANPLSFKYLQLNGAELLVLYLLLTGFALAFLKKWKAGLYLGLASGAVLLLLLCRDKMEVMQQDRLIVYNVSRHSGIERIRGNHYHSLTTDTVKAISFVTRQAHTGFGAWKAAANNVSPDYFILKGKRILLLHAPNLEGDTTAFPVDVLILQCPLKSLKPAQLQQVYHPAIIVADGTQPRWAIQKWKDACAALKQPFHAVSKDGAFIME